MTIIFMDESGYTRENLMDVEQPFFTLATLCCSEEECKNYVGRFFNKLKAPEAELKYKNLIRNGKQELILGFLEELAKSPELVKIWVCFKRFELTKRMVTRIISPAARKAGIDLRIKGRDLALAYGMFIVIPDLAGKDYFDDLLRRFQTMMVRLDHESYDQFFDPLFADRCPKTSDAANQEFLDFYLDRIKDAHRTVGYALIDQENEIAQSMGVPHSRPLDVAIPGAIMLMQEWRKGIQDDIILIHDESSRMAEVTHLWRTFFHPYPPSAVRKSLSNPKGSTIGIADTYLVKSENWRGVQLADILAGATRSWADWLLGGRKPDDSYGASLDPIMVKLQPIPNWPVEPVTQEYFEKAGLTEEEARAQDELVEKLTAFHNLRAGGYMYQVLPEVDE